jgi:hypothetical protein
MTQSPKDAWNARYNEEGFAYGHEPNDFLKKHVHLFPEKSKILFVAEGEGRNAVFAATQGHEAIAFDLSEAGKVKAENWMRQCNTTIQYEISDLIEFDFGKEKWDAVVFIYSHFPKPLQEMAIEKSIRGLKMGGLFLMECFSEKHLEYRNLSNVGGPADIALLYDIKTIEKHFDSFEHIYFGEEIIELAEGKYHQGTGAVIRGIFRKV